MKLIQNSLQYRLAVSVAGVLMLMALGVGILSFAAGYRSEIASATEIQKQLVGTIQIQAEIAAFTNNEDIARETISGLLSSPSIARVSLSSTSGFSLEQGRATKLPADDMHARRYSLYSPTDRVTMIGTLTVHADHEYVRNKAQRAAIRDVLADLVQILLTGSIIVLVFRRAVGNPISKLAADMAQLVPGTPQRLTVNPDHQNDEIGTLTARANGLLATAERALLEERELRLRIEAMEQHYRRIFDSTNVGIMVLQADGKLINSNPVLLQKIVGISFDGNFTPATEDFVTAIFVEPDIAWSMIREAGTSGNSVAADLQLRTDNSGPRWAHCIISVSRDPEKNVEFIEGVLYDVTTRRLQEEKMQERAESDPLTGLRNRLGCETVIDRALRHAREDEVQVGIMLIDLDGFKEVNDTLGHAAGDTVLIEVARRLTHRIRRTMDMVARLGGDEFVVMVYNPGPREVMAKIAADLVAALAEPIQLESGQIAQIGASIGISIFPSGGTTRAPLFSEADRAMYEIKRRGKNGYAFAADNDNDTKNLAGRFVYVVNEPWTHISARGPFDVEAIQTVRDAERRAHLRAADQNSRVALIVFEGSAEITESAKAAYAAYIEERHAAGLNPTACGMVFGPDVVGRAKMAEFLSHTLGAAGVSCRAFDREADAEKWLRGFLDKPPPPA